MRYNLGIARIKSEFLNIEILMLLPLPVKKRTTTAVVTRDKPSGLDRNDRQKCSHLQTAHTSYPNRFNKYCILLLWARLKISYGSQYVVYYVVYAIMSVCMCVKQQTDDF